MKRLRGTIMLAPRANAAALRDAPLYGVDPVMLDLEDVVSLKGKDPARISVHSVLKAFDYGNIGIVVRVNVLNAGGTEDTEAMVLTGVNVVRLLETETAQDTIGVEAVITEAEQQNNTPVGTTKMMVVIESAEGVLNVPTIAKSSTRLTGITLGSEDYATSMKTQHHPDGRELFFTRSMILHVARAAGTAATDTVYPNIDNTGGFEAEVRLVKQLGFDGKSAINPRQIPSVNTIYAPTEKEVQNAREVIWGIREAEAKDSGIISVNGEVVDKPIVGRVERVIVLTLATKLITEEEIQTWQ